MYRKAMQMVSTFLLYLHFVEISSIKSQFYGNRSFSQKQHLVIVEIVYV